MLKNKADEKKENELVSFRKLTLLKSKINRCFLLLSVLEPFIQSNFDVNISGEIVTSQVVLDHLALKSRI